MEGNTPWGRMDVRKINAALGYISKRVESN